MIKKYMFYFMTIYFLYIASSTSNLLANSLQGFLPQVVYSVGQNSDGSEIGDIDNDGENELVVGNRGSMDLHIFKQSKTNKNSLELDYVHKINWAMGVIDIADMNEDGLNDVIISHYTNYTSSSSKPNHFGVCFQDPQTHTLQKEINYSFPSGKSSRAIDVGDVDSDGKLEIAVANEESGNKLFIFGWNKDKKTFEVESTHGGIKGQTISIVIADVTGDGKNDVITHGGALLVYEQDENGSLKAAKSYKSSGEVAAVGDLNGDGLNDVVCNTAYGKNSVVWLQNKSTHQFEKNKTLNINSYTEDVEIADLNGDGRKDVVVADRDKSILFIYYQTAPGELVGPEKHQGEKGKWLNELAVGDLNGDSCNDIIAANWGAMKVGQLYEANVSVWFYDKPTLISSVSSPHNNHGISLKKSHLIFTVSKSQDVSLTAYNLLGKKNIILNNTFLAQGYHRIDLQDKFSTHGVYILHLKTKDFESKNQYNYLSQ